MMIWRIKRIYEELSDADGYRVLVDRLWSYRIPEKVVRLDEWYKDVAPSTKARRDFRHDPARFGESKARYHTGLTASGATGVPAERLTGRPVVTLLYTTRGPNINQTVVLQEVLSDPQAIS